MIITHKITMNLAKRDVSPLVDVMQDDKYSRNLEIRLLKDLQPFDIPSDCSILVRYEKADRTRGGYDTLPDGTRAWSTAGNVLTIAVAPQVCTAPGTVKMVVTLICGASELNSFPIQLYVHAAHGKSFRSGDYLSITGFIPQPEEILPGQYLAVSAIDNSGRISAVTGANPPMSAYELACEGGYKGTEADFIQKLSAETDTTLTKNGAAADAAAVGSTIGSLSGRVSVLENADSQTIAPTWISGKYIFYSTGTESESSAYVLTDYIDVSRLYVVNVLTKVAGYAGVCLYDANKKYITGCQPAYELTALDVSQASYLRVSCMADYVDTAVIQSDIAKGLAAQLKYDDAVGNYADIRISINAENFVDGYLYSNGITVASSSIYKYSNFIPILGGHRITICNATPAGGAIVHFYNDSFAVVDSVENSNTGVVQSSTVVEAPSDAVYMRINVRTDTTDLSNVSAEYTDGVKNGYLADTLVQQWFNVSHQKIAKLFRRATSKLICTVIDDDTADTASVERAIAAADANGIKITFATLTYNWTKDSSLKDTLLALERAGHQVVLHAYSQIDAYLAPDDNGNLELIEDDFVHGMQDMHTAGFCNPGFWVTPYGACSESIQRIARKWGTEAACATHNTYNTTDGSAGRYNLNRLALNERDSTGTDDIYTSSLAELKAMLDEAAACSGWVILMTHFTNWTDGEYSRFTEAAEYAKALGFEFMTLGEAWNYRKAIYELNDIF